GRRRACGTAAPRPPAVPGRGAPRPRAAAEHVPSHDDRADVSRALLVDRGAGVDNAALLPCVAPPGRELPHPQVQALATDTKRVLGALAGTGDEPVEGHRRR